MAEKVCIRILWFMIFLPVHITTIKDAFIYHKKIIPCIICIFCVEIYLIFIKKWTKN